jgi:hypothetical protein
VTSNGDIDKVIYPKEKIKVDFCNIGVDSSPLGYAANNGHLEVCKSLLEAGANVLETDDCYTRILE